MKGFIVWLMGDKLGESTINGLNWLLEVPPDRSVTKGKTSDEITLEHAFQLLELMRSKVKQLHDIVEQVRQSTHRTQHQYNLKCQRHQELLEMAVEYKQMGQIMEARLAIAKAIEIERISPEFQTKLASSQEMLMRVNDIHVQQESELSLLEIDVENMKAWIAMNGYHEAKSHELIILKDKIEQSSIAAENRCQEIKLLSQLSHSSNCELGETLNTQDIDNRLENIDNPTQNSEN
jgi:peptidyl-tRNA hydrolase